MLRKETFSPQDRPYENIRQFPVGRGRQWRQEDLNANWLWQHRVGGNIALVHISSLCVIRVIPFYYLLDFTFGIFGNFVPLCWA